MKKRMLAVMLPVAAFVALAGTGFGVWVFNTASSASQVASYNVTNAISVGAISITADDNSITLDQKNSDLQLKYSTKVTASEVVGGGRTGGTAYSDWANNSAATADIDVTYNFKVELNEKMSTYLNNATITSTASSYKAGDFVQKYTSVANNTVETETYTINFTWKAQPNTLAAYNKMLTDLKTGTITITAAVVTAALAA